MITQYFDTNARLIIQAPGSLAPATQNDWVYGDNYNLAIYLVAQGAFLAIGANDVLGLMLFQEQADNPQTELAIISATQILTDPSGNKYYFVNVNLKTTALAALVQTPNKPQPCQFHYTFEPADGERFSSSADITITVNPDPTESAAGASPVPPGYPTNPDIFEQVANKNMASGYVGLTAQSLINPVIIPVNTTLAVAGGLLGVVGGGSGGGNPYVASISAGFAIPAAGATTASLTMGAAVPDLIAGQGVLITDGVSFVNGVIKTVSGTALTVENNGAPGDVSGTMNAGAHVYLGNAAGIVRALLAGLVPALPATPTLTNFLRDDGGFATPSYPALANIPAQFPPSPHQGTHLPGGADPITLATAVAGGAGLCPAPDGSTIQISGGRLVATPYLGIGQHGCGLKDSVGGVSLTVNVWVPIPFNSVFWDTDAFHSGTSPWTVLTIPAAQYGIYLITATVFLPSQTNTGIRISIWLGGTSGTELAVYESQFSTVSSFFPAVTISGIAYLGTATPPNPVGPGTWTPETTVEVAVRQMGQSTAPSLPSSSSLTLQRIA